MIKDLDRIKTRIDRRSKRLPISFRFANELRLRSVARDQLIEPHNRDLRVGEVEHEQQKDAGINAAGYSESFPPFASFRKLSAALPPTVRQKIQFHRRRRRFDSNQFGLTFENTRNCIAELVTCFVEQHVRE